MLPDLFNDVLLADLESARSSVDSKLARRSSFSVVVLPLRRFSLLGNSLDNRLEESVADRGSSLEVRLGLSLSAMLSVEALVTAALSPSSDVDTNDCVELLSLPLRPLRNLPNFAIGDGDGDRPMSAAILECLILRSQLALMTLSNKMS